MGKARETFKKIWQIDFTKFFFIRLYVNFNGCKMPEKGNKKINKIMKKLPQINEEIATFCM